MASVIVIMGSSSMSWHTAAERMIARRDAPPRPGADYCSAVASAAGSLSAAGSAAAAVASASA
ncbi:hypothetical protein, partial [Sphingomonas sp.]|uniref:hypothetical protein n=1 Tax=Sphingomonas sp. TaxID=28214 RepID=UPI0035C87134